MKYQPNPKLTADSLPERVDKKTGGRYLLLEEMVRKELNYESIRKMFLVSYPTAKRWALIIKKKLENELP